MIVSCEQCQTRFKIPDEKVTERGVKVRCTRCGHTFRVSKSAAQTLTDDPAAPAAPRVAAPPVDPFSRFGREGRPIDAEVTRPGMFALGVEASRNPDLGARPSAPPFPAPSPKRGAEPGDPFDFGSLKPPPPAAGAFDFSAFAAPQVAPASAPPPPARPNPSQPANPGFGALVAPPPPSTGPFGFAAGQGSADRSPVASSDPFGFSALPPAAPSAAPQWSSPGAGSNPFAGAAPPPPSAGSGGADDFFRSPAPQASAGGSLLDVDSITARAMFDIPVPAPALPDLPAPEPEPAAPAPTEAAAPAASAPMPMPVAPPPRRSVFGLIINALVAVVVLAGLFLAVAAVLNNGTLSRETLTVEGLRSLVTPPAELMATDVTNGLYETESGRAVFFVRGEVVNHSSVATKALVKAELLEDERTLRFVEGAAGFPATPEELFKIDGRAAVESLNARVERRATEIAPGESAPFVVFFDEYPPDLREYRVRVSVRPLTPPSTARADE